MKNVTVFTIAAFVAASMSTAALSQAAVGVGGNANANANANASENANLGVGVDTGVAADAAAGAGRENADAPNYGQVISSLRASGDATMEIEAVDNTATVDVVALSELRGEAAENAQALDQALAHQEEQVGDMRDAIQANTNLSAALEAEGYTANDVVAVSTTADGEVVMIVDG